MSKLTKFERTNKVTGEVQTFIAVDGNIKSIGTDKENSNGTVYNRFTAECSLPDGSTMLVGGQVYANLYPHIGGKPEIGKKMQFVANVVDLKTKNNMYWNVGGNAVDDISDDFLAQIDALEE